MKILFLCKANVGRSQMAAGLYNKLTNSHDADSAGTYVDVPNETLLERRQRRGGTYTIDVMQDEGVDVSHNPRTQLAQDMMNGYDKIISMAEPEFTPDWLSSDARYTYWEVTDPQGKDFAATKEAKEKIKVRLQEFLSAKLTTFIFDSKELAVSYVSTDQVKEGVECDIYSFDGDTAKDLAIIRVQPGFSTPLQEVLSSEQTVEGYVHGIGYLTTQSPAGEMARYDFSPDTLHSNPVVVNVGELMQWKATGNSELTFFEVCTPPYEDGRFKNIEN